MITLIKYSNRKIYGPLESGRKGYALIEDLMGLIRQGKSFQVVTHRVKKDVTEDVLDECVNRLKLPTEVKIDLIKRYLNKSEV